MAVGVGMYGPAIAATLLIMLTLVSLETWEHKVRIGQESRVINVRVGRVVADVHTYREIFRAHDLHLSTFYIEIDYEKDETEISFVILARRGADYLKVFEALRMLEPTKTITLSSQVDI